MPDYEKSIKKVKQEMPDVADVDVQPASYLSKFFANRSGRNVRATANPFTGNISYNPAFMDQLSDPERENIFAHELTHSRQIRNTPMLQRLMNVGRSMLPQFMGGDEEYAMRPREMEAYQTERNRSLAQGINTPDPVSGARDIELLPSPNLSKRQAMFDRLRGGR